MPRVIRTLCSQSRCGVPGSKVSEDLLTLGKRIHAKPLTGSLLWTTGHRIDMTVRWREFFDLISGTDIDPGLQAELPAAVEQAVTGRVNPLLRLALLTRIYNRSLISDPEDSSFPRYLASICTDPVRAPWPAHLNETQRRTALTREASAYQAAATGGFGRWALQYRAPECISWPDSPRPEGIHGRLPGVPTLVFSGDLDIRTSLEGARLATRLFPHAHLVVIPNSGHATVFSIRGGVNKKCAAVFAAWKSGRSVPTRCRDLGPRLLPVSLASNDIRRLPPYPGVPNAVAKLATAVVRTVQDARVALEIAHYSADKSTTIPGLVSGRAVGRVARFSLSHYSITRGASLSGELTSLTDSLAAPLGDGSIQVNGGKGRSGTLVVRNGHLIGRLGSSRVRLAL